METKDNFLSNIGKTLYKYYIFISSIMLICIITYVLCVDIFISNTSEIGAISTSQKLHERLAELLVHFIPLLIIFLFINPLIDLYNRIKDKNQENLVLNEIRKLDPYLRKMQSFPEIELIEPSFKSLKWKDLLDKATEIDLCIFYTNSQFNNELYQFNKFFKSGGILNLFLPNPFNISDPFFKSLEVHPDIAVKILRTAQAFREEYKKVNKGVLNIQFLDFGFNYMFAKISRPNKAIFLYSPYQNNKNENLSPVIIYNLANMNETLERFIEEEVSLIKMKDTSNTINFDSNKYIVWDKEKNRVIVSSSLSCHSNCKFCYVESLVDSDNEEFFTDLGTKIAKTIVTDSKFIAGSNGTSILLGGFSDPFLPKNIEVTTEIVTSIAKFKNYIHIATRHTINDNIRFFELLKQYQNIIINYSFSSLDPKIETIDNFDKRFEEMKKLISYGIKTALYIRPVIPNITTKYVADFISRANNVGIKAVTVGGLYIDKRIQNELFSNGVKINDKDTTNKVFVLDNKNLLRKLKGSDAEKVKNMFTKANIRTYSNSTEIINFFKVNR